MAETPVTNPPEPTKPTETKPIGNAPVEFASAEEIRKAKEHLVEIEAFYLQFAGKKDHNPFFFLHQTVAPLLLDLNNPKVMKSTIREALALKKDEALAKADKYVEKKTVDYSSFVVQKPGTPKPATLK